MRDLETRQRAEYAAHNATPLFKGYAPGGTGTPFPAVTCLSLNEQVVHGIPGPRALRDGDLLKVDTACRLNGWCGDSAWTYPVGKISPQLQNLLDVTLATLNLAFELMHTKTRWSQVAREMAAYRQIDRTTLQGEDVETCRKSLDLHRSVTEAIAEQKPGLAFKLMGIHLNAPAIVDEFPDGGTH